GGVEDALGGRVVPEAEDEEVGVVQPEPQQRLLDGEPHGGADAGVALEHDDDVLAPAPGAVADGGAAAPPLRPAPVEPADAVLDVALDVARRHAEAGAESERDDAHTTAPENHLLPACRHGSIV